MQLLRWHAHRDDIALDAHRLEYHAIARTTIHQPIDKATLRLTQLRLARSIHPTLRCCRLCRLLLHNLRGGLHPATNHRVERHLCLRRAQRHRLSCRGLLNCSTALRHLCRLRGRRCGYCRRPCHTLRRRLRGGSRCGYGRRLHHRLRGGCRLRRLWRGGYKCGEVELRSVA